MLIDMKLAIDGLCLINLLMSAVMSNQYSSNPSKMSTLLLSTSIAMLLKA